MLKVQIYIYKNAAQNAYKLLCRINLYAEELLLQISNKQLR